MGERRQGRKTLGSEGSSAPSAAAELRARCGEDSRAGCGAGRPPSARPRSRLQRLLPLRLPGLLLRELSQKSPTTGYLPGKSGRWVPKQPGPLGAAGRAECSCGAQSCGMVFENTIAPLALPGCQPRGQGDPQTRASSPVPDSGGEVGARGSETPVGRAGCPRSRAHTDDASGFGRKVAGVGSRALS